MNDVTGLNGWALIEIFGHSRLAGRVSEQTVGGSALLRVDVPDENGGVKFTKFLGVASIFSISLVSEEIARRAASRIEAEPITTYELTQIEYEQIRKNAEERLKREEERAKLPAPRGNWDHPYDNDDLNRNDEEGAAADDIPFDDDREPIQPGDYRYH